MAKSYHQYCPVAHALDLVGERWSLLVVRELIHGPLRYSDLLERLGCATNILADAAAGARAGQRDREAEAAAARGLDDLRAHGVRPWACGRCLHALGHWGARSLGPPPRRCRAAAPAGSRARSSAALPRAWRRGRASSFASATRSYWLKDGRSLTRHPPRSTPSSRPTRGLLPPVIDGDIDAIEVEGDRSAVGAARRRATRSSPPS